MIDSNISFMTMPLVVAIIANIICLINHIMLCNKKHELYLREKELDKVELWLDKRLLDIEKREERINIL